jgi:hypothetical protein
VSVTLIRTSDPQPVRDALVEYYSAATRPGPLDVVAEAGRRLVVWEDGFEPAASAALEVRVSPVVGGWVALAFPRVVTFDLPLAAWLARDLRTESVAAYTWGDGYGCVAFDARGVAWSDGHIRDERSDMHLRQLLRSAGIPFDGDEDCEAAGGSAGWPVVSVPPRPWPPVTPAGKADSAVG